MRANARLNSNHGYPCKKFVTITRLAATTVNDFPYFFYLCLNLNVNSMNRVSFLELAVCGRDTVELLPD